MSFGKPSLPFPFLSPFHIISQIIRLRGRIHPHSYITFIQHPHSKPHLPPKYIYYYMSIQMALSKIFKSNWMPTQSWLLHKNQPWCIPTKYFAIKITLWICKDHTLKLNAQTKYGWNTRTNQVAIHQKLFAKFK